MTEESFKRKLTAILSADVEGYSRLMGEGATIRTLTAYRVLMSTLIQKHRGRIAPPNIQPAEKRWPDVEVTIEVGPSLEE